jgi:hypothetical protein
MHWVKGGLERNQNHLHTSVKFITINRFFGSAPVALNAEKCKQMPLVPNALHSCTADRVTVTRNTRHSLHTLRLPLNCPATALLSHFDGSPWLLNGGL